MAGKFSPRALGKVLRWKTPEIPLEPIALRDYMSCHSIGKNEYRQTFIWRSSMWRTPSFARSGQIPDLTVWNSRYKSCCGRDLHQRRNVFRNVGRADWLARSLASRCCSTFLGDALTYGLKPLRYPPEPQVRSRPPLLKGFSLLAMGLGCFGSTVYRSSFSACPAEIRLLSPCLLLPANLAAVFLLTPLQERCKCRSVWLCSRNDCYRQRPRS